MTFKCNICSSSGSIDIAIGENNENISSLTQCSNCGYIRPNYNKWIIFIKSDEETLHLLAGFFIPSGMMSEDIIILGNSEEMKSLSYIEHLVMMHPQIDAKWLSRVVSNLPDPKGRSHKSLLSVSYNTTWS